MLEIAPLLDRKPRALSGGQRQRVAMGRAIVRNPKVFLFDEPLSNLDAKLRVQMRTEIKKVHQTVPTTTVYVTHDQIEAMTLADRVVVMNDGVIEQVGTPQELYHHPGHALRRRVHRLAGDELPAVPGSGRRERRPRRQGDGSDHSAGAAGAGGPLRRDTRAGRWCWDCGRSICLSTTSRPSPAGPASTCRWTWSSRWAWRRWCISSSTVPRSVPGSIRPPMPSPDEMLPLTADLNQMHLMEPDSGQVV